MACIVVLTFEVELEGTAKRVEFSSGVVETKPLAEALAVFLTKKVGANCKVEIKKAGMLSRLASCMRGRNNYVF